MDKNGLAVHIVRGLTIIAVMGVLAIAGAVSLQARASSGPGFTLWCEKGNGVTFGIYPSPVPIEGKHCFSQKDDALHFIGKSPTDIAMQNVPPGVKARWTADGTYNPHTCSGSSPMGEYPAPGKPWFIRCDGGWMLLSLPK